MVRLGCIRTHARTSIATTLLNIKKHFFYTGETPFDKVDLPLAEWGEVSYITGCMAHIARTYYSLEIRTRRRCSLGFWPAPVERQIISELLQFEHGERLSHLIYAWDKDAIVSWLDKSQKMNR